MKLSLRLALAIVAMIAALLATYRIGFEHGRTVGPIIGTYHVNAYSLKDNVFTREYDVSDLVDSREHGEALIEAIRQSMGLGPYASDGSLGSISYESDTRTIVVSQTWHNQLLVGGYLVEMREAVYQWGPYAYDEFSELIWETNATYAELYAPFQ